MLSRGQTSKHLWVNFLLLSIEERDPRLLQTPPLKQCIATIVVKRFFLLLGRTQYSTRFSLPVIVIHNIFELLIGKFATWKKIHQLLRHWN